ncbi:MAG TPA: polymer-forming cytoskeletal protein [Methanomicrobiales archaeon]|nr:polymer-forming cytoskeletal protein [Methanomicrobiales archaeon]
MKVYRWDHTFIVPRGSFFEGNVRIEGDLLVPRDTHFWGRLVVEGDLALGPYSTVEAGVWCANAVIGDHVRIRGPLVANGDVLVCDAAAIGRIEAARDVTLRPGVQVGDVASGRTILVQGKIASGRLLGRTVKVIGAE